MSVFHKTCGWEQQKLNNTKKQKMKVGEKSFVVLAYRPLMVATQVVDEKPNELNLHPSSIHYPLEWTY